jgi:hypothetical protein
MKQVFSFPLVLLACVVAAAPAKGQAQEEIAPSTTELPTTFDGHFLHVGLGSAAAIVDLGCEGRSALRVGTKLFVACGVDGVVELDVSNPRLPRRSGTMPVDGDATGLFLRDGRAWVVVAHVDARPVNVPRSPSAPSQAPAPPLADAQSAPNNTPEEESAPSIVAPPRRGDLWEISLLASGFLALGQLGGGMLNAASVVYRFKLPLVVRAEFAPFGVGFGPLTTLNFSQNFTNASTHGGSVGVVAGHLLFGVDTQFVELTLGVGGATANQETGAPGTAAAGGFTIVDEARFGARDGLALDLESITLAANGRFDLGAFSGVVQIPLSRNVLLLLRGGGGNIGYAFGDLGARVFVHGDGGKGTVALTGFAGGAFIGLNLCSINPDPPNASSCNTASLAGPSLGGGVEWRP